MKTSTDRSYNRDEPWKHDAKWKKLVPRISLVAQGLRLRAPSAGGEGYIPVWGINDPTCHALQHTPPKITSIKKKKEASLQRSHSVWFHLYEMSRIGKFTDTECRLVVAKVWGKRVWEWLFNGYRVSNLGWWKCFGNKHDGCTTLWIDSVPLNCTS